MFFFDVMDLKRVMQISLNISTFLFFYLHPLFDCLIIRDSLYFDRKEESMKKIVVVSLFLIVSLSMSGCNEEKTELQVAAAASLTDAMKEIKTVYEKEHDVGLSFNCAGSGKLAQQIQQGAPVDVFVSANEDWMDQLEQ